MRPNTVCSKLLYKAVVLAVVAVAAGTIGQAQQPESPASPTSSADALKAIDRLIEQNRLLEQQTQKLQQENRQLLEQIRAIRQQLDGAPSGSVATSAPQVTNDARAVPASPQAPGPSDASLETSTAANQETQATAEEEQKTWGTYTPNFGYKIANTKYGDVNLSIFTYVRYLNQHGLDDTYTNAFGITSPIQQRQDVELNKLQIKFLGWLLTPKLRYFLYSWTNNAAQGRSFYVALAGYTGFNFSKHFSLWGGLNALPGTRSVEGNFPFWLGVDSRHIADEFFRPSYTSGIWAKGDITDKLRYHAMVGNNLSTLGVNAAQFNGKFNSFATALVWTPTTGEFGPGFGDFEDHEKVATRLGAHFTRSDESRESQPNTDAFENTQIRLSDGTVIFTPEIFGPGVTVTDVRYRMAAMDGGIKYRGNAIEGEYFWRWLDNYRGPGTSVVPNFFDHGFQVQASSMVVPKQLQVYLGGSKIYGQFGKPWDARLGVNFFPYKNRVVRWNNEALYLYESPVGYTAVPFAVGGKGWAFHSNVEVAF